MALRFFRNSVILFCSDYRSLGRGRAFCLDLRNLMCIYVRRVSYSLLMTRLARMYETVPRLVRVKTRDIYWEVSLFIINITKTEINALVKYMAML